jgi:regulator of protease activity HflC (stomatin/prohibitin superfamily)
VAEAEAKRRAAEEEAEQRKVLADARAYEIEKINESIRENPAYLQLEALKTLQAMASDPAAKLYFLDSKSPMPLPLMNIGEPLIQQRQQQVRDEAEDERASGGSARRAARD